MLILKKKVKMEAFSMYVVAYNLGANSPEVDAKFVLTDASNTLASISDKGIITVSNEELGGSIEVSCYFNDSVDTYTIKLDELDDLNIGDTVSLDT